MDTLRGRWSFRYFCVNPAYVGTVSFNFFDKVGEESLGQGRRGRETCSWEALIDDQEAGAMVVA